MATAQLPQSIEIFRPGRHIDDQGATREFTAADLAAIAAGYDPQVREAPLTIGHPEHDRPAYGWVSGVHVNDAGRLAITPRDAEPQFAEMVAARRFPKRSAAFYPPEHPNNPTPGRWYLRHVAFLGAQPPAIAGLKDIQFADDAAGLVYFSEADASPKQEHRTMTEEEKAAIARAEKAEADAKAAAEAKTQAEAKAAAAEKALAQFAEQQRTARHASHVAFCEGLAAAEGEHAGKLLPKDVQVAAAALDLLADAQPVEFAEGDTTRKVPPVEWLKALLSSRAPAVQFGEFAPGNAGKDTRPASALSDGELHKRATAYMAKHNVNYAEALGKCASFTAEVQA